jgi:diguanylate cyclase
MPSPDVIELGLRDEPWLRALRAVVDPALALLGEAVAPAGASGHKALALVAECRAALSTDLAPDAFIAMAARCLDACQRVIVDLVAEQAEQRRDIGTLVALVRDAIAAVSGDAQRFHADVGASADRFDTIAHLNDLRQIKSRLVEEVGALRETAAQRQAEWKATVDSFTTRVTSLEDQLLATRRAAGIDALTNLANRGLFDRTLGEWTKAPRSAFVLAMIDIDRFKTINDTHGHAVGDRALAEVASLLAAAVRQRDFIARYGGDEYVVLIESVTLRQAESRLREVVAAVRDSQRADGALPFVITISCGAAEFSAGDTPASLLRRADEALYDAKRTGRDRVVVKAAPYVRDLSKS